MYSNYRRPFCGYRWRWNWPGHGGGIVLTGGDSDNVIGAKVSKYVGLYSFSQSASRHSTRSTLSRRLLLSAGHYRNRPKENPANSNWLHKSICSDGRPALEASRRMVKARVRLSAARGILIRPPQRPLSAMTTPAWAHWAAAVTERPHDTRSVLIRYGVAALAAAGVSCELPSQTRCLSVSVRLYALSHASSIHLHELSLFFASFEMCSPFFCLSNT